MEKLIEAVGNGEPWAIKELLDRTLGKADQRLEVTGEGGGPVASEITLKLQFADRSLVTAEPPRLLESDNKPPTDECVGFGSPSWPEVRSGR